MNLFLTLRRNPGAADHHLAALARDLDGIAQIGSYPMQGRNHLQFAGEAVRGLRAVSSSGDWLVLKRV